MKNKCHIPDLMASFRIYGCCFKYSLLNLHEKDSKLNRSILMSFIMYIFFKFYKQDVLIVRCDHICDMIIQQN